MICVNDEHLKKTPSPIEFTEEGIVICVNDEHPLKASSPIEVTEEGIDTLIKENSFFNRSHRWWY